MQIDEATNADVPELSELLGVLFRQEVEFTPDREKQEAGLRLIIGDPDVGQVIVLRANGRVCGMVSLLYSISTALGCRVATLEDMVVASDQRGTGAGSALLQAAIGRAKLAGCGRITLLTDASNAAAQRFYGRAGFSRSTMVPMRMSLRGPDAG